MTGRFSLAAITVSYHTQFWFRWVVIVGGQVPCALACAVLARFPGLAAVYLSGYALLLVALNWPMLAGVRRP